MDSVSQFALGAAIGGALLGRRAGARALLWGGIVATLPDLDVLIPMDDPVDRVTYHRSASHSLLVLTLAAPLVTWLILRLQPDQRPLWRRWLWMVWLVLITHPLLDAFTVYGTQLFWPIWVHPVGWDTLFIIDPLYTLPLLAAVAAGLVVRHQPQRLQCWSTAALLVSSAYLAFSLGAKWQVTQVARSELAAQGIAYRQLLTVPTAFNTVLWRVVVMDDGGYHEGYYSLLDPLKRKGDQTIEFRRYPDRRDLLAPIADSRAVQRLAWFTKDFYRVARDGDAITLTDLRMGQEPAYVFSFVVGREVAGAVVAVPPVRAPLEEGWSPGELAGELWARVSEGPGYRIDDGAGGPALR